MSLQLARFTYIKPPLHSLKVGDLVYYRWGIFEEYIVVQIHETGAFIKVCESEDYSAWYFSWALSAEPGGPGFPFPKEWGDENNILVHIQDDLTITMGLETVWFPGMRIPSYES